MAAAVPDRGPPSLAAVALSFALIGAVAGYYIGQARSIGLFSFASDSPPRQKDHHQRHATLADTSGSDEDGEDDDDDDDDDEDDGLASCELNTFSDTKEECKLVLVVRTDLGMTKGKIAAQCSHATLACYKTFLRTDPAHPILKRWERLGQAKVALKIDSEDDMLMLQAQAVSLGLCAQVIHDAGRTQIASGSATVLGIGPAPKSKIDQVTGHLKLL